MSEASSLATSQAAPVPFVDLRAQYEELRAELRAALEQVLEAAAFVGGEEVEAFEAEFAAYCGARQCAAVGNGTDALSLALRALGVGARDRVLTVPFTFAATVEAIESVGAQPVLVDIDAGDYTIDVDAAVRAIERSGARAVIAVHLFGHPADLGRLVAVCRRRRVALIEDAAQAHGAEVQVDGRWHRVGGVGDAGCFSFYPTKNLGGMGDGGAVVTQDSSLARTIRALRDHGQFEKGVHAVPGGTNSRLDALQAAVLRVKLRHLDRWNEARRAAARHYAGLLQGLPVVLPRERPRAKSVFHQYAVLLPDRDQVRERLRVSGVEARAYYPLPVHLQPAFAHLGCREGSFPVAERCAREVLSLPLFPHITGEQQARVAEALRRALRPAGGQEA